MPTPPTTTSNAPMGSVTGPVTVSFTAADNAGGSGVARTEYSTNGTTWTTGTSCVVSVTGATTLSFRSVDVAGNVEATKTATVTITSTTPPGGDTIPPSTVAMPASGEQGHSITFKFKVIDPQPASKTATVTIEIRSRFGGESRSRTVAVVKTIAVGTAKTNVLVAYRARLSLRHGSYTYRVLATDAAGNVATQIGSARLTIGD